jgi:alkylhydroperoxidase family enzyme
LLKDYRDWLESELKLLGNASHHAYSFGQANMAKRALERLDEELARTLYVPFDRAEARRVLTAIEALGQATTSLPPELEALREAIKLAMVQENEPADI